MPYMKKKIYYLSVIFALPCIAYSSRELYWHFLFKEQQSYVQKIAEREFFDHDTKRKYEKLIDSGLKLKPENMIFRYEKFKMRLIDKDYTGAIEALKPVQGKWEARQFICAIYDYRNYPEQEVLSCYKDAANMMRKKNNVYSSDAYVMSLFFSNEMSCDDAKKNMPNSSMLKKILVKTCDRKRIINEYIDILSGR